MEKLVMENLFGGIYKNKKVLMTGHSGFKGSWLMMWLKEMGASVKGYSLKPNTDPAHILLLNQFDEKSEGDINRLDHLIGVFQSFQPEIVFHLAAQPLVRYSYQNPVETFATNVIGTSNVLEAARLTSSVKAIVNVTTDKVYENYEWVWPYKETDRLGGHDPYSTSKACVELVHQSFRRSYFKHAGILSVTARAGNVIGGGDWAQDRLIPDMIRAIQSGKTVEIRNPDSVRPWQHVLDPLSGYLLLGMHLLNGNHLMEGEWNFGPDTQDCISVREVLNQMHGHWEKVEWKDVSSAEKVHEANMLRLDCSKAHHEIKWQPVWDVQQSISQTAAWYKNFYANNSVLSPAQLKIYIEAAKAKKNIWAI